MERSGHVEILRVLVLSDMCCTMETALATSRDGTHGRRSQHDLHQESALLKHSGAVEYSCKSLDNQCNCVTNAVQ